MTTYPSDEHLEVLVDDGLDNATIYICEPNGHPRANDEQPCHDQHLAHLSAFPRGDDLFYEFNDATDELLVDLTLTILLFLFLFQHGFLSRALVDLLDTVDSHQNRQCSYNLQARGLRVS